MPLIDPIAGSPIIAASLALKGKSWPCKFSEGVHVGIIREGDSGPFTIYLFRPDRPQYNGFVLHVIDSDWHTATEKAWAISRRI